MLAASVCGAVGIGLGVLAAASDTMIDYQVSSLELPVTSNTPALVAWTSGLSVVGSTNPSGTECANWPIDSETFRLLAPATSPCTEPIAETEAPVSAVSVNPYSNDTLVRIARRNANTGRLTLGPVVMHYSDSSDTHLVQTYGDGSLWVYDAATPHGGLLLRVSPTTGQVENTVQVPGDPIRPMLVTDDDGLFMAVQVNGGVQGAASGAPIYRVAPGSDSARIVHRGGYAAFWIAAGGHTVWVDIPSLVPHSHGAIAQELWSFSGAQAEPVLHRDVTGTTWEAVTAGPDGSLWAAVTQAGRVAAPCAAPEIITEAPESTTTTTAAHLPVAGEQALSCEQLSLDDDIAFSSGALYLVSNAVGQIARLWRISD